MAMFRLGALAPRGYATPLAAPRLGPAYTARSGCEHPRSTGGRSYVKQISGAVPGSASERVRAWAWRVR
jgi:hypothetical protein